MNNKKEIIASNLTIAFYSGQKPRKGYLGIERRKEDTLGELERDMREDSLTPKEVHETYNRFLELLQE